MPSAPLRYVGQVRPRTVLTYALRGPPHFDSRDTIRPCKRLYGTTPITQADGGEERHSTVDSLSAHNPTNSTNRPSKRLITRLRSVLESAEKEGTADSRAQRARLSPATNFDKSLYHPLLARTPYRKHVGQFKKGKTYEKRPKLAPRKQRTVTPSATVGDERWADDARPQEHPDNASPQGWPDDARASSELEGAGQTKPKPKDLSASTLSTSSRLSPEVGRKVVTTGNDLPGQPPAQDRVQAEESRIQYASGIDRSERTYRIHVSRDLDTSSTGDGKDSPGSSGNVSSRSKETGTDGFVLVVGKKRLNRSSAYLLHQRNKLVPAAEKAPARDTRPSADMRRQNDEQSVQGQRVPQQRIDEGGSEQRHISEVPCPPSTMTVDGHPLPQEPSIWETILVPGKGRNIVRRVRRITPNETSKGKLEQQHRPTSVTGVASTRDTKSSTETYPQATKDLDDRQLLSQHSQEPSIRQLLRLIMDKVCGQDVSEHSAAKKDTEPPIRYMLSQIMKMFDNQDNNTSPPRNDNEVWDTTHVESTEPSVKDMLRQVLRRLQGHANGKGPGQPMDSSRSGQRHSRNSPDSDPPTESEATNPPAPQSESLDESQVSPISKQADGTEAEGSPAGSSNLGNSQIFTKPDEANDSQLETPPSLQPENSESHPPCSGSDDQDVRNDR